MSTAEHPLTPVLTGGVYAILLVLVFCSTVQPVLAAPGIEPFWSKAVLVRFGLALGLCLVLSIVASIFLYYIEQRETRR